MNYIYRQYSNLYNIYILFLQFNSPIFYLICPAFLPHNIIQRCRFVNGCLHTLLRYDIKKQIQGYFIPTIYRIFFRCLDITLPNTPSRQQAVIGYDIIDGYCLVTVIHNCNLRLVFVYFHPIIFIIYFSPNW